MTTAEVRAQERATDKREAVQDALLQVRRLLGTSAGPIVSSSLTVTGHATLNTFSGTMTAGSVPAALVTAGTFGGGTGDYAFGEDVSIAGRLLVGLASHAASSPTATIGGAAIQLVLAENMTNATAKNMRLGGAHYTNSEEPIAAVLVNASLTGNAVQIGGGAGAMNAATAIGFWTAATTTTTTGTELMRLTSSQLRLGSMTAGFGGARLDVVAEANGISFLMSDSITDAAQKLGRLGSRHFTNSEEPMAVIVSNSDTTNNTVNIGGGTSAFNAATLVQIYTGATTTTTTGTVRATWASDGAFSTTSSGAINFIRRNTNGSTNVLALDNADSTAVTLHSAALLWRFSDTAATLSDAASIVIAKAQEWTSSAATKDSSMAFRVAIDNVLTTGMTISVVSSLPFLTVAGATQFNSTITASASVSSGQIAHFTNTSNTASGEVVLATRTTDSAAFGASYIGRRSRTTGGAVQNNDVLSGLYGQGHDGTSFYNVNTGAIRILAAETHTVGPARGTKIDFATTTIGASTRTVRGTITDAGLFDWDYAITVDGLLTSGNDHVFTGSTGIIRTDTADASDTKAIAITGGGGTSNTRGALIILYGNENATQNGRLQLTTGNATAADFLAQIKGVDFLSVTRPAATNLLAFIGQATFSDVLAVSSGGIAVTGDSSIAGTLTATSTTGPQLSARYNGSGVHMTVSVASTGVTTFDASGASAAFVFADDVSMNALAATTGTFSNLLQVTRTTEQLRLRYDASNYLSVAVASNGATTFDANGAGAAFTFSDAVSMPALTATTGTFTDLVQITRTTEQMRVRYDSSNYFTVTVSSAGRATLDAVGSDSCFQFNDPIFVNSSIRFWKGLLADADSIAIGQDALSATTTGGIQNIAIGRSALNALTTGLGVVAIGYRAFDSHTLAADTVAIGMDAGGAGADSTDSDSARRSVLIGARAGLAMTRSANISIGWEAGIAQTSGVLNVLIGTSVAGVLTTASNTVIVGTSGAPALVDGSSNTGVGYNVFQSLTSGTTNTAVGRQSGATVTTGSNNITIGYQSAVSGAAVSNEITLGNGSITAFRIPGLSWSATATTFTIGQSLQTAAPSGGAGAWKLGIINAVSPTAPNRTVTIDVGGTVIYLHGKTTND